MKFTTVILALALAALSYSRPVSVCHAAMNTDSSDTCCCAAPKSEPVDSCCSKEQDAAPETPAPCSCHIERPDAQARTTEPAAAVSRTDILKFSLDISQGIFQPIGLSKAESWVDLHASGPPGPPRPLYIYDCSLLI